MDEIKTEHPASAETTFNKKKDRYQIQKKENGTKNNFKKLSEISSLEKLAISEFSQRAVSSVIPEYFDDAAQAVITNLHNVDLKGGKLWSYRTAIERLTNLNGLTEEQAKYCFDYGRAIATMKKYARLAASPNLFDTKEGREAKAEARKWCGMAYAVEKGYSLPDYVRSARSMLAALLPTSPVSKQALQGLRKRMEACFRDNKNCQRLRTIVGLNSSATPKRAS